jgi:hypothetical protein
MLRTKFRLPSFRGDMKQKILAGFVIALLVLSFIPAFLSSPAAASTAMVGASKDSYIDSGHSNVNFGSSQQMIVGLANYFPTGCGGDQARGLVEFILGLPEGAVVVSAYLQLYYFGYTVSNPVGEVIYAQRLKRVGYWAWTETGATWNYYNEGAQWIAAGASNMPLDYTVDGQASATIPAAYGRMSWDVTSQVEWAVANGENAAFRLVCPACETDFGCYGANCYGAKFYTKEYSDPSCQPRLLINYEISTAPVVGTEEVDDIGFTYANCHGNILRVMESSDTTRRGIKYGLTQTDSWDKYESGNFTVGPFSLNLTGLQWNTTYWYRAYATNEYGTGYGSWASFQTGAGVPTVTTGYAYVVQYCSLIATMYGNITDEGLSNVITRGFEWGLNITSPSGDTHENGSFDVGQYSLSDTVGSNESYWFRAYATNSYGTGYGIWKPFGVPESWTPEPPTECSPGSIWIYNVTDLQNMSLNLSASYCLMNDIDASATSGWNGGAGFEPVGTFTGSFEGNGHKITGLYINRGLTSYVGLFGYTNNATVSNVTIYVTAVGANYTGGLVGCAANSNFTNCIVNGAIDGWNYVGIVAGYIGGTSPMASAITRCGAGGSVDGNNYVGGFVGEIYDAVYIYDSFSLTDVSASSGSENVHFRVGGFVGLSKGHIYRCYAAGDVVGSHDGVYRTCVGGFVGYTCSSYTQDCYARGGVLGSNSNPIYAYVGGFVGEQEGGPTFGYSTIDNCYSTGSVGGNSNYLGGFMGSQQGGSSWAFCTDNFWDIQGSGRSSSACGTGKDTPEMKVQSTFTDAGWDFVNVWSIDPMVNDGYPYFVRLLTGGETVTDYTLTISSSAGGNVTVPGEGEFIYGYGTIVNLVATPDEGYRFVFWTGDVSEITDRHDVTTTIRVVGNTEIVANFVPEGKLALFISSEGCGSVTDPGEGLFSYDLHDFVNLVATPGSNCTFVAWEGDTDTIADTSAAATTIEMLDDYVIVATFVTGNGTEFYSLYIASTDGGDVIDPGEGLFEYAPGTIVDLTALAYEGSSFIEWSGDVDTVDDIESDITFVTMNGDYSILANFSVGTTEFTLTIISSEGGNVTTPGEGSFIYYVGTVVNLVATAEEGYEFFAWTGDTQTVDDAVNADTTIIMNGDYVIVANFEITEECSLLLGLTATEGGEITAPGEGPFTFPCGSLVTITAEAYSGWWFKEWTGDIESVANPLSFNTTVLMVDDYLITANFVQEEAPPAGAPNVTTLATSDIASSSAWLNGSLDSLGDYDDGYVFFQYGTTTSYGTNTREQLRTATGNFSSWINNLASNTTYHYRAVCRYGSYVYGEDGNFTTLEGETCADCLWAGIEPYESYLTGDDDLAMIYGANWYGQTFTVETESHSAVDVRLLVYRVGTPSTITVSIRECGADGLPTGDDLTSGTFDGDSITNSTGGSWYGTTLSETGLAYGVTYAICVRAEAGDIDNYLAMRLDTTNGYGGGQAITSSSGGVIWTADTGNDAMFQIYGRALIRVFEAKVFNSYLEDDDALIVLSYLNTYVPYYPNEIASLHFWLQLRTSNGDTILSQTVCQQWGYMPGSIYLNANQAASLTNGWPYRIYLAGTSPERPVACYILQPNDWLGDALSLLPPWVISTANSVAAYYGTAMTTQVQNREVLNSEGGVLFAAGIPSLIITNPELFQDISFIPSINPITPGPTNFDTSTTWEKQVGPVVARLANGLGGVVGGISGKYIIAAIFFIIYLLICYLVVRAKADPIIATFLCVPILLGVAELRVIDFQLITAIGAVAVIMTVYRFHWSRT